MKSTSEPGIERKSGSSRHLEALEILPLLICRRNGKNVDIESATSSEFTAWLRWSGIPFTGSEEWTFDSKCAIVNYALSHGIKPRLVAYPSSSLEDVLHLFEVHEVASESAP